VNPRSFRARTANARALSQIKEHLGRSAACALHVFQDPTIPAQVSLTLAQIAAERHHRFTSLDGTSIDTEQALLAALAQACQFPNLSDVGSARIVWDSALDWLSDLTWITGLPPGSSGVTGLILLYSHPAQLLSNDLFAFVTFLDVVGEAVHRHRKDQDISFHLVVGPLSAKGVQLIQMLRISHLACIESDWPEHRGVSIYQSPQIPS
jgi:hypothetical protein